MKHHRMNDASVRGDFRPGEAGKNLIRWATESARGPILVLEVPDSQAADRWGAGYIASERSGWS